MSSFGRFESAAVLGWARYSWCCTEEILPGKINECKPKLCVVFRNSGNRPRSNPRCNPNSRECCSWDNPYSLYIIEFPSQWCCSCSMDWENAWIWCAPGTFNITDQPQTAHLASIGVFGKCQYSVESRLKVVHTMLILWTETIQFIFGIDDLSFTASGQLDVIGARAVRIWLRNIRIAFRRCF